GAGMGTGDDGSAVCNARPARRDFARQNHPVFRAWNDRADIMSSCRQVSLPRAFPRFGYPAGWGFDALFAGGVGHWASDLLYAQKPIRGEPGRSSGYISARG